MIYDNRAAPPLPGFGPGLHFGFEIRGRRLLYCYIRKNACSAFKRMIVARSPERRQLGAFPSRLKFMRRFHGVRDIRAEDFDHAIFVYRDPVERLLSVWRNKFIQFDGNTDIFASYAAVTGRAPEAASFAEFLEVYMARPLPDLNVHVHPQAASLAPIRYSDAIALGELHARMERIVGPKAAARYFLHSTNSSTAPAPEAPDTGAAEAPAPEAAADAPGSARGIAAADLHRRWKETGTMPGAAALLGPGDAAAIRALYDADCRMLETLRRPEAAPHPEAVAP